MLRSYLLTFTCLLGIAFAPSVQAGPVFSADQLISQVGGVSMKLTNYEGIGVDLNSNGMLEVGDTLRGIFRITSANATLGGPLLLLDGFELTGIFETEILSVDVNANAGGSSYSDFTFGPHAGFEAVYGAGAMLAFFEDFAPDFDDVFTAGTPGAAEVFATNGTLYATFGSEGTHGIDYHWTASGYANLADFGNPLLDLTTVFAASLELLTQPGTGLIFLDNLTQAPVQAFTGLGLGAIQNELALQGNVVNNPSGAPYPLESQDPVRLNAIVPEPSSILAWAGFAIFGGLTYRRRRATAAKA